MIYVKQHGRCGNQLFLYAFARSLQIQRGNDDIVMDFSQLGSEKGEFWGDSLKLFNTIDYSIKSEMNPVKTEGTTVQRIMSAIISRMNGFIPGHPREKIPQYLDQHLFSFFSNWGIYFNRSGFYCKYKLSDLPNIFISGLFESSKFLDPIRHLLISELSPRNELSESAKELLNIIQNSNAICISFRNWDIDVDDTKIKNRRSICDYGYYEQAIRLMQEQIQNPVFVVFSDDVKWATQITKEIVGKQDVVISESGQDDVSIKLKLMSSCKHFILANSTFCWWAQYLCEYEEKIVVSPEKWLKINNKSSLMENWWMTI